MTNVPIKTYTNSIWWTVKSFPQWLGTYKGADYKYLYTHIILEVESNTVSQEKQIQGIKIGKEETKLSLFIEDMVVYKEKLKKPIDNH